MVYVSVRVDVYTYWDVNLLSSTESGKRKPDTFYVSSYLPRVLR